ncbi:ArsR/SmtB family transcription factor [Mycolicibacterium hodleri]|uniref:ArsR/SmtB family transcription factor n=1 Tax=Mycolicibacterium hodleri TaxID=49897 RepID=UPI0021F28845|nr:helix-turn-helix transcriptional regulator [Mycolicibacterium hodleri]
MNDTPALGSSGRGDADVGHIASLLGDPSRARMLMVLADGRAHPASALATAVGLSRPAATAHLQRLVTGGLVRVEQVGRFRLHSLASPEVARLVEALAAVAPPQRVTSLKASNTAAALRAGRTCYDHLAGRLGVAVADALRSHDAVHFEDPPADIAAGASPAPIRLGPAADSIFTALHVSFGVNAITPTRRAALRLCVDWSERRFHIAGGLGAAMLESWLTRDWVTRRSGRSVCLTPYGCKKLQAALPGINLHT